LDLEGVADDDLLSSMRSPLSAKLAVDESSAFKRLLKQVEEGKIGQDPQAVEDKGVAIALFIRDGGSKSESLCPLCVCLLETRKFTNPSRSWIRWSKSVKAA